MSDASFHQRSLDRPVATRGVGLHSGAQVTLLERAPDVGSGASYGNGGQLSYRYVAPLADAGLESELVEHLAGGELTVSLWLARKSAGRVRQRKAA